MDDTCANIIRTIFQRLISDADKAAADAVQAYEDAIVMVADAGDAEDEEYAAEERRRTNAEAFSRDRVLLALIVAEQLALGQISIGGDVPSRHRRQKSVVVPCVCCGKELTYPADSPVGRGLLVSFCRDGDCEDRFAAAQ